MDDSTRLAAYIEEWRSQQSNLSRSALLKLAGLSGTWLTQLERGADVQIGSVAKMAQAMGMTLGELIDNAGLGRGQAGSDRPDILELIRTDPALLPEATRHFANQYRLLVRLNPQNGHDHRSEESPVLRAVAHEPDEPITADQDEAAYDA
jgi:transcriptional regulator with XRE-family HTH domain